MSQSPSTWLLAAGVAAISITIGGAAAIVVIQRGWTGRQGKPDVPPNPEPEPRTCSPRGSDVAARTETVVKVEKDQVTLLLAATTIVAHRACELDDEQKRVAHFFSEDDRPPADDELYALAKRFDDERGGIGITLRINGSIATAICRDKRWPNHAHALASRLAGRFCEAIKALEATRPIPVDDELEGAVRHQLEYLLAA